MRVCTCIDGGFGNRCKDRTSRTRSLLNSRESSRFRRAFYRWYLSINLFPAFYLRKTKTVGENADDEWSDTEDYDDTNDDIDDGTDGDTYDDDNHNGNDDDPPVYIIKSQDMRRGFFSEFSDDEVAEMWQVHNFMKFVSLCTRNAIPEPSIHECGLLNSIYLVLHPVITFKLRQPSYCGTVPPPLRKSHEPSGPSVNRKSI